MTSITAINSRDISLTDVISGLAAAFPSTVKATNHVYQVALVSDPSIVITFIGSDLTYSANLRLVGGTLTGVQVRQSDQGDSTLLAEFTDCNIAALDLTKTFGKGEYQPLFDLFGSTDFIGSNGIDRINLSSRRDTANGLNGADEIAGGAGDDKLSGGTGNDRISGDDGNDYLTGDAGGDIILGGAGNDVLYGGDGENTVLGGEGNDTLYTDQQSKIDRLGGGPGDDIPRLPGNPKNRLPSGDFGIRLGG